MSYAYQGYRRKATSSKRAGTRKSKSKLSMAGGGEGETGAPQGTGAPMSAGALKALGFAAKAVLGPVLGTIAERGLTKANQRAHVRAHADTVGDPGQYGAGSGDSPSAVAGHDASDVDSAGQGGSDPSADN